MQAGNDFVVDTNTAESNRRSEELHGFLGASRTDTVTTVGVSLSTCAAMTIDNQNVVFSRFGHGDSSFRCVNALRGGSL